jgi:homeobox protein cut-like
LERHLASVELQLRSERAGRHATQAHLLEADEGLREREAAWEAQRQILVDDAERLRERLYQITKERDEAVMKLSAFMVDSGEDAPRFSFNSDGASIMSTDVLLEKKAYEAEVHDLSMTIASLSEEIRSKEEAMLELRRSSSAKIEAVEAENSHLLKKVNALEVEIATAPSKEAIDNMRRELRVLKKLEYNVIDVETDAEPETSTPYKSVGNEETDLETVLINKVRRIEADLLKERREKGERETEIVLLRCKNDELEVAKADSDRLIMRLEADLERAVTASNNLEILEGDKAKGISSQLGSTNTLQRILESSDAELGMTSPSPPSQKTSTLIDKTVDDHSVATIVMAQRDRLRIRCDALEAEKDSFKRELQIQVALSESLKSDNSKLFEKVKFLQSYNNTLGQVQMRAGKINADIDLEAFEQRYEASVDPFRQFSKTERMRKLKEMSPVERIVFVVAKTVLGSKEMRTFLFAYVLGMHLLVFFTTYHWAHEKGCSNLNFHHEDLQHFHGGVPRPETGPF